MARPLKANGLQEAGALKTRIRRQRALGRIGQDDHDYLIEHLEKIEARIVEMDEETEEESWL
jgi:uncharacterized protein YecE (DUF72 family)